MKLLILGLVALSAAVPQQRLRPRQGRQNVGGSYLAPDADTSELDSNHLLPNAPSESYGVAASEDNAAFAAAPDSYAAAASELDYDDYDPNDVPADQAAPQPAYTPEAAADPADMGMKMMMNAIPGTPGADYPIYSSVPDTSFSCSGQLDGGYYADPEAECQVFHICTADGQGGLSKYSFLCPNGTIFNQNYFICDWWFNFDCADAEALAVEKNNELAAARVAADEAAAASAAVGSASQQDAAYASPAADYDTNTGAGHNDASDAAGSSSLSSYSSR